MANRADILGLILTVLIITVIGMQVMAAATGPEAQAYANAADDYCEQELGPDAVLVNSRVIGEHGGLHCEGPNGAFIHLHDVPREEVMAAANNTTS